MVSCAFFCFICVFKVVKLYFFTRCTPNVAGTFLAWHGKELVATIFSYKGRTASVLWIFYVCTSFCTIKLERIGNIIIKVSSLLFFTAEQKLQCTTSYDDFRSIIRVSQSNCAKYSQRCPTIQHTAQKIHLFLYKLSHFQRLLNVYKEGRLKYTDWFLRNLESCLSFFITLFSSRSASLMWAVKWTNATSRLRVQKSFRKLAIFLERENEWQVWVCFPSLQP